ncbi:hypothetical protein JZ751_003526 [Albula glossodonta]|uniref:Rhodanese domain-containing protein n=1 Tax=Albula glossodonta TaxID=121402 RepID=A0A8T2N638_9TELE|nr:hypothetical protein JZ751_003526 [Albula glossodonta]
MASKRSMGCSEYMKKKVPRNPKYQYVKPKVDTGCSLIKYMERMEELKKNMWAVPPVDNMSVLLDVEMGHNNSPQDMAEHIIDEDSDSEPESSRRSTLQSFPITNLARTMDPYIKELLEYKNAPGKIIILYDEDERIASVAATTLFERGFENVFMLSGGLRVIAQKFPEGMTTGTFPAQCRMSPMATRSLTRAPPLLDFQPAERKWRFTFEDIRNIQQHQEELLVPSASKSQLTITSKSSSLSKSSSTRSQRAPSVGGTDGSRSQRAPSVGGTDGCRPQSGRPWR